MKIFLNIFIAVAAILVPVYSRADGPMVLWWQVGDEFDDTPTGESLRDVMVTWGPASVSAYDLGVNAARIRETSTDTYLMMLNPEAYFADGMTMLFDMDYMNVPTVWQADISDFAAGSPEYSFVIELGSYEDETWSTLATSEPSTYGELSGRYIVPAQGGYLPNPGGVWVPAAYSVPEPGSGTLVLVGVALLALRRRRRQHG